MSDANRSLFRHRDFLKLWSAETISQFGTQVTLLALPIIAATTLNVTPFEFGMLATVEFLPFILLSLPAGVWVDRLRRRPILIAGDLVRAAALISIPIAFALDALTIWQLYIVGFINGCATVFFDVAYQSYLPSLVDRDQIVDGNAKLQTSVSGAQITGPGLAGLLIGAFTAPFAILIDALSFVVSALFMFAIRRHETAPEPQLNAQGERPSMRSEIVQGLRYVGRQRFLRSIAATTGLSNFFSNVVYSILILYLVRELLFTPEVLGLAFSVGAVGFLLGALIANRVASRFGVGPTIVGSAFAFGPSTLLIAIAPAGHRRAVCRGQRLRRWSWCRHLQHQPGEPAAGDHPGANAGPDERDDAIHRLGDDPDRCDRRRIPRRRHRPPRDDLDRCDRRDLRVPARPVLARSIPPADPRS